ncbi:hypothetical protein, partial [Marinomonas polaris]|uniref:hypothetical protein n=1 Tax=Marinomonas polaris TaxID=293552 RepID=UPI003F9D6EC0
SKSTLTKWQLHRICYRVSKLHFLLPLLCSPNADVSFRLTPKTEARFITSKLPLLVMCFATECYL